MSKSDLVRLRHTLDAAREASSFARDRPRADLDSNRMLTLSLVHLLEIEGEAAVRVTEEGRSRYPRVPWRQIVGLRNRLVHGYDDIDLDRLWEILATDLPPLTAELDRILATEQEKPSSRE